MNHFKRIIEPTLLKAVEQFPIVTLTGPRQSGKTTLLQACFKEHQYVNLEDPQILFRIKDDPRAFLQTGSWIIDEAQNFPELFSYLQVEVDRASQPGRFILSGSQNFLLSEKISQTLAGRTVVLELLPLSYAEYISHPAIQSYSLWDWLYHGSYPRPYQESLDLDLWYSSYIRTYLERDVRSITHVKDLSRFQLFIKLCAGFHGQLLNLQSIAQVCGIANSTAGEWLSILEASYLVYRLHPFYKNFKKRVVKMPKLYFYDTAIVCKLLGIESSAHLQIHASRGAIFEGFILSEIIKHRFAKGQRENLYFWRDHAGMEVDGIIEHASYLSALEIKSGLTLTSASFDSLLRWQILSASEPGHSYLIYAGQEDFQHKNITVLSWQSFAKQVSFQEQSQEL